MGGKATGLFPSDVAGLRAVVTVKAGAGKGGIGIFGCSKAFTSAYHTCVYDPEVIDSLERRKR